MLFLGGIILLNKSSFIIDKSLIFIIGGCILISYCALWYSFALDAASSGKYIKINWNPFVFLADSVSDFKNITKIVKDTRKNHKLILIKLCDYIILSIITFFLLVCLEKVAIAIKPLGSTIFLLLLLIFSVVGLDFMIRDVHKSFVDWRRWRKWNNKKPIKISIENLLSILSNYHDKHYWEKIISFTRKNNILMPDENSEIILEQLALIIEEYIYHKGKLLTSNSIFLIFFDQIALSKKINIILSSKPALLNMWFKKNGELKSLRELEYNLDEVYLILEQVRSLRKVDSTSN